MPAPLRSIVRISEWTPTSGISDTQSPIHWPSTTASSSVALSARPGASSLQVLMLHDNYKLGHVLGRKESGWWRIPVCITTVLCNQREALHSRTWTRNRWEESTSSAQSCALVHRKKCDRVRIECDRVQTRWVSDTHDSSKSKCNSSPSKGISPGKRRGNRPIAEASRWPTPPNFESLSLDTQLEGINEISTVPVLRLFGLANSLPGVTGYRQNPKIPHSTIIPIIDMFFRPEK